MKKIWICGVFAAVLCFSAAAEADPLLSGLEAYARSDWTASVLSFRKAVSQKETATAEAWYWLIMSEMSAGDYVSAAADADIFLSSFKNDPLYPDVMYQRGRALYYLQKYEQSVVQLYAFFSAYPDHALASSALFWIGESLYDMGNFENARLMYTRVMQEYPESPKREAAAYRVALISQRGREDELLRILKATHENSLKIIEEYERRERIYEQAVTAYQKRIAELMKDTRLSEMEAELSAEKVKNAALFERVTALEEQNARLMSGTAVREQETGDDGLEQLKEKARTVESLLDQKTGGAR